MDHVPVVMFAVVVVSVLAHSISHAITVPSRLWTRREPWSQFENRTDLVRKQN
jgi:hypothetical protein